MGLASAQAWILFILIFIISVIILRAMGRITYYDAKEGEIL
jgi:ABC-type sugar transport system permease subunit